MVKVSVSELKARLSEHIRRVKGGEEVLVTERGRVVAILAPVPTARSAHDELEALVDAGLVRRASRELDDSFWHLPRGGDPNGAVVRALVEERREGR